MVTFLDGFTLPLGDLSVPLGDFGFGFIRFPPLLPSPFIPSATRTSSSCSSFSFLSRSTFHRCAIARASYGLSGAASCSCSCFVDFFLEDFFFLYFTFSDVFLSVSASTSTVGSSTLSFRLRLFHDLLDFDFIFSGEVTVIL